MFVWYEVEIQRRPALGAEMATPPTSVGLKTTQSPSESRTTIPFYYFWRCRLQKSQGLSACDGAVPSGSCPDGHCLWGYSLWILDQD